MTFSLSALESFYWVAQLRSFSVAAEKLNITQPTVSYRIGELEKQLGVLLVVRNKRKFLLTDEGEALKHYAESMIAIAQDIESNIKTRNTRLPTLRVGVIDSFAAVCLPLLLDELNIRFVGTRVAATVDTSHRLAELLSEGLLDIAVLSTPPRHDNVALELLGHQTVDWIASEKVTMGGPFVTDADLLKQRIFATPAPSNLHSLIVGALAATAGGQLRLNICNSIGTILTLVEAGTGISMLPTRLVSRQIELGTLKVLKTREMLPLQDVFIGTNKGTIARALPQAAQMIRKISESVHYCN